MYEDTPNKEEIDWFAERLREIYNYERLKDCDIDYLYNREFGVENKRMMFEAGFPHEKSAMQGPVRAFMYDNENEMKESLTEAERMRLILLMEEITVEIHRAFGYRKELHREHRSKIANAFSDSISGIFRGLGNLIGR